MSIKAQKGANTDLLIAWVALVLAVIAFLVQVTSILRPDWVPGVIAQLADSALGIIGAAIELIIIGLSASHIHKRKSVPAAEIDWFVLGLVAIFAILAMVVIAVLQS